MTFATEATLAFQRQELTVNGVKVELLVAGRGEPLLFLHGAGMLGGMDFALPLAKHFKLVLPVHPGFGASDDNVGFSSIQDYVLHYLDLLDQLSIDRFRLVGFSLGGWMAAALAAQNPARVEKLCLVAPAGLYAPDHPTADLFRIKPREILSYLTARPEAFLPFLPPPGDVDAILASYREQTSLARIMWDRPYDRKLTPWLHRIRAPSLLLWGDQDRIVPVAQAADWAGHLPDPEVRVFKNAGHLLLQEEPAALEAINRFMRGEPAVARPDR